MSTDKNRTSHTDGSAKTLTRPKATTRRPRQFAVVLHNDDFTSMEFVVFVLVDVFDKNATEAAELMWSVHTEGAARVGTYPREVAETKRDETMTLAEAQDMPLLVSIEPAEP